MQWASQPINILGVVEIKPSDYLAQFRAQLVALISKAASPFASGAWNVLVSVSSSVLWLIFILVVAFYLIKDSAQVGRYLRGLIPISYRDEFLRLLSEISDIWRSFFRGQVILGLIIGVGTGVAMTILGVRNAAMLGLIAGILEVIPNFGPTIAAIPAILLALVWGSSTFPHLNHLWFGVIIAGAYILIQQLENNLIVPRVIGRSVKLHPVVVLVGSVAGAVLGGVLGVLLASPTIATLRVLTRYAFRKASDLDPFEGPPRPPRGVIGGRRIAAVILDLEGALLAPEAPAANRWTAMIHQTVKRPALLILRARRALRRKTSNAGARPALALASALRRAGLTDKANAIEARWSRLRRPRVANPQRPAGAEVPVPDASADDLLTYLVGRFKAAVISRRSEAEVQQILEHGDLDLYFDAIITRSGEEDAQPQAMPILAAAAMLEMRPEQCAVVSRNRNALEEARAAGAAFVGIVNHHGRREDLSDADLLVEKLGELRQWF